MRNCGWQTTMQVVGMVQEALEAQARSVGALAHRQAASVRTLVLLEVGAYFRVVSKALHLDLRATQPRLDLVEGYSERSLPNLQEYSASQPQVHLSLAPQTRQALPLVNSLHQPLHLEACSQAAPVRCSAAAPKPSLQALVFRLGVLIPTQHPERAILFLASLNHSRPPALVSRDLALTRVRLSPQYLVVREAALDLPRLKVRLPASSRLQTPVDLACSVRIQMPAPTRTNLPLAASSALALILPTRARAAVSSQARVTKRKAALSSVVVITTTTATTTRQVAASVSPSRRSPCFLARKLAAISSARTPATVYSRQQIRTITHSGIQ